MNHRTRAGMVCVLAGLALAGCGTHTKSSTSARRTTAATPTTAASAHTASPQAHKFIPPPANAIVAMRRFSPVSLMWQTVFVQPDGHGLLTSLIGETGGAPHRPFQLSASQLAKLRRLIAAAKSVKPGPSKPGDYLYTLHIPGEAQISFEGPMPGRLRALVDFLDGLTLTYCC